MLKRMFDFLCSLFGLFALVPVFLFIAIWIKCDSRGPVFFRQIRVGRNEIPFKIFKFRSMRADADSFGIQVTTSDDGRITRSGRFIRKFKIDELPQLINILQGDMSLVGPRPEVPKYVRCYPYDFRRIALSVKPGITDIASIKYRNENDLLASANEPEKIYIEQVLPEKLRFVQKQSFLFDMQLIFKTLWLIVLKK